MVNSTEHCGKLAENTDRVVPRDAKPPAPLDFQNRQGHAVDRMRTFLWFCTKFLLVPLDSDSNFHAYSVCMRVIPGSRICSLCRQARGKRSTRITKTGWAGSDATPDQRRCHVCLPKFGTATFSPRLSSLTLPHLPWDCVQEKQRAPRQHWLCAGQSGVGGLPPWPPLSAHREL